MNKKILSGVLITFACIGHVFAGGSIEGTIKYAGPVPKSKLQPMDADPICYAINKGNTRLASIAVGENNTLKDAFIYVKSGLPQSSYPPPNEPAVMDQKGCNYSPRVMGVMAGQKVKFLNPDGTLHNVHIMSKINPEMNVAMPDFRKEMETTFKKTEFMFPIRCDVHPWMLAWMAVMPHPFFSVSSEEGKFEIKNLPAGTYEIEAWHEKLESKTMTLTVIDGKSQQADFTFSTPKQ